MATNVNKYSGLKRNQIQEKSLQITQLNCNSLSNKVSELKIYIYSTKPDIMCLCETHLKRDGPKIQGYDSLWLPRVVGEKGGLAIIIRQDIKHRVLDLQQYQGGNMEYQAIEISSGIGIINIMNIYNPHKDITHAEISHYIQQLEPSFILVGDFNAHSPMWDMRGRSNSSGRSLETVLAGGRVGLLNVPEIPTYIDHRMGTTSCLDLCLVSMNLAVIGELTRGRDLGSDHFPIVSFWN